MNQLHDAAKMALDALNNPPLGYVGDAATQAIDALTAILALPDAPPAAWIQPGFIPERHDGGSMNDWLLAGWSPLYAIPQLAWWPSFDATSLEQEALAIQFCCEIAGAKGESGNPPDPVRLLEMAEALYEAERDAKGSDK